jgi:DHA1 family tetracycline resistance protein-like MFS transporter
VKNRSALTLIFLTVFIDLLGFGILIPILPTFAITKLHVSETAVGIAIAIYSLVQFIFNPLFGKFSDKNGRKPIIIICLLLNALGYVIFAFSNTYLLLIISRIVGGIGGSSIGVAQAYIADITTKENRSKGMGMIGAAFGLGFVFGPLFGGLLSKFGYMVTGFSSAGFSTLALLFTLFLLPESHTQIEKGKKIGKKLLDIEAMKIIFKKTDIAFLIILFFILTFTTASIYAIVPLLGFKVYSFSNLQNGYIFGIVGFVGALVQGGLIRVVSNSISDLKLVAIGSILMMIGFALLPYGGNFFGLAVVAVVLALGIGILQPILLSLISKVTSDEEQGITLGINQSLSAFARVLGPLWGGFTFEFLGFSFPFLSSAAFTLIIVIISIISLPKKVHIHEEIENYEINTKDHKAGMH